MAPIDSPPSAYETDYDPNAPVNGLPPTVTIVQIYPAVMRERPETIRNAAHGWNRLCSGIWSTWHDLGQSGDKLRTHWKSEAAEYFFPYIEGTRASLDEWQNVAYTNYTVLMNLADTVQSLQSVMHEIWQRFTHEQDQNYGRSVELDINPTLIRFTDEAVHKVLTPFSNAFSTAWSAITAGNKFQGPTDAEKPADGALERIAKVLAPHPGGIAAPSTGALPAAPAVAAPAAPPVSVAPGEPLPPSVTAPAVPSMESTAPDAPTAPTAPSAPEEPTAPNALTAPDASTAPEADLRRSGPASADALAPIPAPGIPAVPEFSMPDAMPPMGAGSVALTEAGLARGAIAGDIPPSPPGPTADGATDSAPTALRGRTAPRPPGGLPSAEAEMPPRLPGRSQPGRGRSVRNPRPDEPGRIRFPGVDSGGGPLLGRRGQQNSGRIVEPPFTGTATPRQLQGIRSRTGIRAPFVGDIDPGTLSGRRVPTAAPTEEVLESAARQALRPGLGGRGRSMPARGRQDRTGRDHRAPQTVYVGIDERFEVDKPAAVIDRPTDTPAPARSGPALRPPTNDAARAG